MSKKRTLLNDFALPAPGVRARRLSSKRIKIEGARTVPSIADDAREGDSLVALQPSVSFNGAEMTVGATISADANPEMTVPRSANGSDRTTYVSRERRNALQQLEDAALLTRFQDGDEAAFYTLFERRQKEIYTHCFRMCGRDSEKANDAFQDTFVKVFTRKALFTDASNGRAWLYRIATNTCLNALRYDKRHPNSAIDDRMASHDPQLQPDFRTEQESLKESLEVAMASLPIELREPFLLREIEEFSYEDAAEQLGISVAACRQKVYRAKQMLREALQEVVRGTMGKNGRQ